MIFKDPVLASDGNTYESDAINIWLEKSKKSPITNKDLANNILNRNIVVRKLLTTLAELTPPEVEIISTEEAINIDI